LDNQSKIVDDLNVEINSYNQKKSENANTQREIDNILKSIEVLKEKDLDSIKNTKIHVLTERLNTLKDKDYLYEVNFEINSLNQAITDSKAEEALARLEQLTKSIDASLTALQAIAMQAMETSAKLVPMVDLLATAPPPKEYKRSRYGSFYDTTTQLATVINTPTAITLNTTDLSNGVYLGTPASRIYADTKGIYNLQTSIQLDKTSGGTAEFYLWFRKNGIDIPDSCSQVRIQGNDAEIFTSLNYFFNLNYADYVEIMFAVTDLSVELKTFPATAFSPAIPSIIVTVSNNIEGLTS
jgi:hypothetical protein